MRPARLVSCWFEVPDGRAWPPVWYERHARVLEHSARKNTPDWTIDVRKIAPAVPMMSAYGGNLSSAFAYNSYKLAWWSQALQDAVDGERMLICDADLMVLRSLDPVWDIPFDVAITTKRECSRIPLNGGVVFVRVNARSRAWFAEWLRWNTKLLGDARLHKRYRETYAGMNQAALGALIENGGGQLADIAELPCREWNCETASWPLFDPSKPPRIVHIKGALRRGLMDPTSANALATPARRQIAAVWWALEKEALSA